MKKFLLLLLCLMSFGVSSAQHLKFQGIEIFGSVERMKQELRENYWRDYLFHVDGFQIMNGTFQNRNAYLFINHSGNKVNGVEVVTECPTRANGSEFVDYLVKKFEDKYNTKAKNNRRNVRYALKSYKIDVDEDDKNLGCIVVTLIRVNKRLLGLSIVDTNTMVVDVEYWDAKSLRENNRNNNDL